MSKIWIILLLVGVIQLVNSYPAPDNEDNIDDEVPADYSGEERGLGEAMKKVKKKFRKAGDKLKNAFNKGRKLLNELGVKVEPLTCEGGNKCKSCINLTAKEKKFCVEFLFTKENGENMMKVTATKEKKDKVKELLPPITVPMGKASTCVKLGEFLGNLCLQGVEGKAKSSKGKADINFCLAAVLEDYGVGAKFCAAYQEGKLKVRIRPKLFPGATESGKIVEAHAEKDDEVKDVSAEEEELEE